MGLLILFVGIALGVSFVCSLLEATLLATKNTTLQQQAEAGHRGAALLLHLKSSRIDDAISAILILNTGSNTLGATMAGAEASRVFGSKWMGLFSGLLTLAILVLSEIIPKTLGAVYPRQLGPAVGWSLHGLAECLERRNAATEALQVRRQFEKSWAHATVEINASCFCRQTK